MHNKDIQVRPPWIEYPESEPTWGGWRQGTSEAWLFDVWMPFWQNLSEEEKNDYLKLFPPPDEGWEFYITDVWK